MRRRALLIANTLAAFVLLYLAFRNNDTAAARAESWLSAHIGRSANYGRESSGPRIGRVTMAFGDELPQIYKTTLAVQQAHSAKHGYQDFILREKLLDPFYFSKPAYLLSLILQERAKPLSERLDWLYWNDLDVLITNPSIPLDIFLPPPDFSHINLLITEDDYMLNSGVFFIRISKWSIRYLSDVIALLTYKPKRHPHWDCPEQRAMGDVLTEKYHKSNFTLLPQRWLNAYIIPLNDSIADKSSSLHLHPEPFHWRPGDLNIHFAGSGSYKEMLPAVTSYFASHAREYNIPLSQTQYQEEIDTYWEDLRRKGYPAAELNIPPRRAMTIDDMIAIGKLPKDFWTGNHDPHAFDNLDLYGEQSELDLGREDAGPDSSDGGGGAVPASGSDVGEKEAEGIGVDGGNG